MKKLKARLRNAIFALFQEEILNAFRGDILPNEVKLVRSELDFKEFRCEMHVDSRNGFPAKAQEDAFRAMRQQLVDAILPMVIIDTTNLFDPYRPRLEGSIYVGKVKQ